MENQIYNILNDMAEFLNVMQMKKLQKVLIYHLNEAKQVQEEISNEKYLEMFLTAKQIEGCSDRTIQYYRVTIEHMLKRITIPLRQIATEDIRQYLIDYQKINNCGKVTIDNIRRNLSSFFSWLEEEDHILKSPVKRIHKIKTKTVVKEVISDESIEILRDNCKEKRDLAIIDLLFSTGMRVGELVNLDIADMHFDPEHYNPVYICKLLCSQYIYDQIVNHAKKAVNQASINQKDVLDFNIYQPPLELQNQFADFVVSVDKSK